MKIHKFTWLLICISLPTMADTTLPGSPAPSVLLQASTPGTQQVGNMNISGVINSGADSAFMLNNTSPLLFNLGTNVAMVQNETIAIHSVNPGIGFYSTNIGASTPWGIYAGKPNGHLEFYTQNVDGTNPQNQCDMFPPVGSNPSLECVGLIRSLQGLVANSGGTQLQLIDSGGGNNNKNWRYHATGASGTLALQACSDDMNGCNDAVSFARTNSNAQPSTVSFPVDIIIGATRTAQLTSGAAEEQWGRHDYVCGDGVTDCPYVQIQAVSHVGLVRQYKRIGNTDSDELEVIKNHNGVVIATYDWSAVHGGRMRIGDSTAPSVALETAGNLSIGTGINNDTGGVKHKRGTAGCATGAVLGNTCTTVVSWTTAFADTNYTATCTGRGIASGVPVYGGLTATAVGSVTVQTVADTAAVAQYTNIDCIAIHD